MTTSGTVLALLTATGSALTAGVFFGFSVLVMPAFRARPAAEAMAAMQAVNRVAPRSLLMVPLLGSAVGGLAVAVHALVTRPDGLALLLVGAAAAVATLAVTVGYHVPRNDALAALDPQEPGSAAAWARYAPGWTRLNSVRAGLALLSAAALVGAVLTAEPPP
ncbi:DUF1772 domain-containing protein [Microlunatus lacustris]